MSNCAENTRGLLDTCGLTPMVDALVLSCEVGCAKPQPAIFEAALDTLGVESHEAVFVDDQEHYCDGAAALGIRTVRIDRDAPAASNACVRLLTDLLPLF